MRSPPCLFPVSATRCFYACHRYPPRIFCVSLRRRAEENFSSAPFKLTRYDRASLIQRHCSLHEISAPQRQLRAAQPVSAPCLCSSEMKTRLTQHELARGESPLRFMGAPATADRGRYRLCRASIAMRTALRSSFGRMIEEMEEPRLGRPLRPRHGPAWRLSPPGAPARPAAPCRVCGRRCGRRAPGWSATD